MKILNGHPIKSEKVTTGANLGRIVQEYSKKQTDKQTCAT
jgi:hypothetical protein